MLKKILGVLTVCSGLLMGASAQANKGYVGVNGSALNYTEAGGFDDLSLTAAYARIGGEFNKYVSGEVRGGAGVEGDTVDVRVGRFTTIETELELKGMLGAYLRVGVPVADVLYPYAVVGFTRLEMEAEAQSFVGTFTHTVDDSDTSVGIGLDINFSSFMGANFEYMSYFDKDGIEIDAGSAGLYLRF